MNSLALNIISKSVINAVMLNVGVWNIILISSTVQVAKALPKHYQSTLQPSWSGVKTLRSESSTMLAIVG